jgi:hypothetical protein
LNEPITTSAARPPSTPWRRGRDRVVSLLEELRRNRDKTRLEQRLARIIETASGHRAKGLPAGAPAYVELLDRASRAIEAYCHEHHLPRPEIEHEVPALRDLERLTRRSSPAVRVVKAVGVLLVGAIGAMAVGSFSALVAVGFHWVVRALLH